jgi:hypothetical protein
MSRKLEVSFEIRDMLIMKETLKQLGHSFREINQDAIEIQRSYNNIRINSKTGKISYDSDHSGEVDKIKQSYMVNFYRDKAIKEGMQIRQEVSANGEVILHVTH